MIVLLLICLKSYPQLIKPTASSTGEILKTDTAKVSITVNFLRDANAKLIERIYLLRIKAEQDSIIQLNKQYIKEQSNVIKDFQKIIVDLNNSNNKLSKAYNKERITGNVYKGITIGSVLAVIAIVLIK